ncbi:MAG: hypothetical protein ONB44_21495, partial [candidate division KSB1 bacterium]|nr:hypothetical protein [candidate division KSB1 bacterium]
ESPMAICVWEGFALKINPKGLYREKHEAKYYPGVHKFVAPVYAGCLEGKPISQAQCRRQTKIYSAVFTVLTR